MAGKMANLLGGEVKEECYLPCFFVHRRLKSLYLLIEEIG